MIPYVLMTSDRRNWLLRGFMHQWHKYAPEIPVIIAGFTRPAFPLLDGFSWVSIGEFANYPANRWSNATIRLFTSVLPVPICAILLEDYWLTRRVDLEALAIAEQYICHDESVVRFDISSDRLYSSTLQDRGSIGRVDIIESLVGDSYRMSLQAGLWRTDLLLQLLIPDETPWQVELDGNMRLQNNPQMRVMGTRQWPIRYQIMVRNGEFIRSGDWLCPKREISDADYRELQGLGYDHE